MFINAQPSRAHLTQTAMGGAGMFAEWDTVLYFGGGVGE